MNKPLVPGSFAAWGRIVSQKMTVFEQATCPHQIGTDRAPGERWWRPAELPACSREPTWKLNGRQRSPQRTRVALWPCEVRSEAPYCIPKGAQRGPGATKGAQQSSKRGIEGCHGHPRGTIAVPGSPKQYQKRCQSRTYKRLNSDSLKKTSNSILLHYLLDFSHISHPPES